jgi:GNAT superfamily N-acetyltransferase
MLRLGNNNSAARRSVLVLNRDIPDIYDANHVDSIRVSLADEIDDLFATVEHQYDHARHRRYDTDFRTPPEFVARLLMQGGYDREDALVMVLEGSLNGSVASQDIRPIQSGSDWESYWELMWVDWMEGQQKQGRVAREDVARQMWHARRLKQPPVRYWLAYVDERPVAYFSSWAGVGGVGQVEDLFTHPDFRLRGIAASLIFHCVGASRDEGAGPIVIAADPTDTPKNIYHRLGFRAVAVASQYLKCLD